MSQPKLRGYLYQIVEMFPIEEGNGIRELHTYDDLAYAEKVLAVLESVNYNFTCYGMMMRPVWEDPVPNSKLPREFGWDANGSPVAFTPCDHNGSTAGMSTDGRFTFHCPKCGVKY